MKPVLVLLPGFMCDQRIWRYQIDRLSDIVEPLFFDLASQDNIDEMVQGVLNATPGRFVLAGFSMGAYVAQEIAVRARARVTGMALFGSTAKPSDAAQTDYKKSLLAQAEREKFTPITRRTLERFIHPERLQDKALCDTIADMGEVLGRATFIRQLQATMCRRDMRAELSSVDCPTLLVCGRQDAVTPVSDHHEMQRLMRHAALEIVEDCGHMVTLEHPAATTNILRQWLSAKYAGDTRISPHSGNG